MAEFVNETINELENIIGILRKVENNDTATLSEAACLLSEAQHAFRCKVNRKVMEDYAIAAFIEKLENKLYKQS